MRRRKNTGETGYDQESDEKLTGDLVSDFGKTKQILLRKLREKLKWILQMIIKHYEYGMQKNLSFFSAVFGSSIFGGISEGKKIKSKLLNLLTFSFFLLFLHQIWNPDTNLKFQRVTLGFQNVSIKFWNVPDLFPNRNPHVFS